jgi:hypothetical protein
MKTPVTPQSYCQTSSGAKQTSPMKSRLDALSPLSATSKKSKKTPADKENTT